jgi:hypothetical protein
MLTPLMSALGLGCAKTKDKFLRFFALRMTLGLKIPGAVIPRRVFTQPGSLSRVSPVQTALRNCTGDERRLFGVGNQVLSSHRKLLRAEPAFVQKTAVACFRTQRARVENGEASDALITEFCGCYANALADVTTAGDVKYFRKYNEPSQTTAARMSSSYERCRASL